jgi:hypothetical protein
MSERDRVWDVIGRLPVALAVGAIVAGAAYYCAFTNMRDSYAYRWMETHTQLKLDWIEKAIQEHRQATGRLPADLAELDAGKAERRFRVNPRGQVVDAWERPYQYRAEGDTFTLYSFGRDGRPGGEGHDADVYPTSARRPLEPLTFRQFTFKEPTDGVQLTCLMAGACAGAVCMRPARNRRGVGFLALVGATAIGAVLVAIVISALHVPSGH